MREETSRWLSPLLQEAERRGTDILPLMQRATMHVSEAVDPYAHWLSQMERDAREQGARVRVGTIDWIRFGQVLADELGWRDYPREPDENPGG